MRPLVPAPRPERAFLFGAFPAVDLEVDRRAAARFVDVLLADDFFAEAFFAEAFFEDLDLSGLA